MQNHYFLQIDERGQITHPRRLMSLKKLILGFSASAVLLTANASEIPSGAITLDQCIQLALENNLSLRITNYQPRLAALSLQGVYGAYDPRLSLGGTDSFRESKGRVNPLEFTIPSSETDSFRHNIGLNGLTPYGTRYSIGLNSSETTGTDSRDFPFGSYGTGFGATITQPLLRGAWILSSVGSVPRGIHFVPPEYCFVVRKTICRRECSICSVICRRLINRRLGASRGHYSQDQRLRLNG